MMVNGGAYAPGPPYSGGTYPGYPQQESPPPRSAADSAFSDLVGDLRKALPRAQNASNGAEEGRFLSVNHAPVFFGDQVDKSAAPSDGNPFA